MAPEGLFPGWQCCLTHRGCQDTSSLPPVLHSLVVKCLPKSTDVWQSQCMVALMVAWGCETDAERLCWTPGSPIACDPGSVLKYATPATLWQGALWSWPSRTSLTDMGKLDLGQQEHLLPAMGVMSITGNLFFLHDVTLHYSPEWRLGCGVCYSDSVTSWEVGWEELALLPPIWASFSRPVRASKQPSIKNTFVLKL